MQHKITFLWDNFGPLHIDRIDACARLLEGRYHVSGIEICGESYAYDWRTGDEGAFERKTLFSGTNLRSLKFWPFLKALIRTSKGDKGAHYVMCHWNEPAIFAFACWLRLRGRRVYTMGCSKFDDKPRKLRGEVLKSLMFLPYHGAIGSGKRSRDYFRFLGVAQTHVVGEYNTVSQDRIRAQAGYGPMTEATPDEGPAFGERDFLCVARLVEKKNLPNLLDAFALYCQSTDRPRQLRFCGSGPLEDMLKARAQELGIEPYVSFEGFLQTEDISKLMSKALALLLPSYEEQFGNVVPEAQSFGLPVLISDNAGARDRLVLSGKTGFVVEPDNREGMAYFLDQLASSSDAWRRLRVAAFEVAPLGDAMRFAEGVEELVDRGKG
ncbi:glycosyltransferase [Celeribacter sp. PS-C1]|uniref:glycosyltransferase n=1 Tax=Celeribacter sp. PS-C1 TaxID=2820813 RepID=UPI001CA55A8A|nr:glycosyltransferase [Celeribacter sp. PS-C1]MBW6417906.1 glycosyltransferase [Celeribacter sp. PS-C1]